MMKRAFHAADHDRSADIDKGANFQSADREKGSSFQSAGIGSFQSADREKGASFNAIDKADEAIISEIHEPSGHLTPRQVMNCVHCVYSR